MKKQIILLCMSVLSIGASAQVTVVDNTRPAAATAQPQGAASYAYYNEYDYVDRAGSWALGINFNAGLGDPSNAGLGLRLQHHATDAFRLEFGGNYFMESKHWTEWDVNLNFHYLIRVYTQMYVYPIIGATFDHWHYNYAGLTDNTGKVGINLGAGYQYDITDRFAATFEMKYKWVKEYERAALSLGIAYRF